MAVYYSKLRKMWEELDHYTTYRPSCVTDSTAYKTHVEEIQIFEFLASLNPEYEQVRVQILNMNLSTFLNEVYAYIHREKRRQGVMNVPSPIEKSTLVSTFSRGGQGGATRSGHDGRFSGSSNGRD